MFQGCQNWSWIGQGVFGSNFIAQPGKTGGWAIQMYCAVLYTHNVGVHMKCSCISCAACILIFIVVVLPASQLAGTIVDVHCILRAPLNNISFH